MTESQAEKTANAVMLVGAAGAAYLILRNPTLRRGAWRMARTWATGPVAVWALGALGRAWRESGGSAA